ncbi:hypothetical protein PRIPAC_95112, partial [Pristionchus pacificus]|uniref:Uncharacterized protein n=1 Tax=Pristionchus pacificus TaxID=54126 RepID=A0A2A6BA90_PRIPA
ILPCLYLALHPRHHRNDSIRAKRTRARTIKRRINRLEYAWDQMALSDSNRQRGRNQMDRDMSSPSST